ncbi:MAG: sulfotransferase [Gammaproteobacteria bacterium]|nr:sulfotransferase [Gammaproteobacteria bacterium]
MVGEQRSGSNLLRLIMNSSNEIAAPHPPHVLQNMMPLIALYGDLNQPASMDRLVDDVCRLVENNPVPWEGIERFDRADVRRRCTENSLIAVFGAVMGIYAQQQRASAWMCKSMQNIRWAKGLNNYFVKPKFIYLCRDPRDVALSFTKAVVGDKHPYFIAGKWLELQELCLDAASWLPRDQFIRIKYEELTDAPEQTVRRLCEFLGIRFVQSMLEFHRSNEASRTATQSTLWENLTRPVIKDNSKKFLRDMSPEHIGIIESLCGEVMDQLGYPRHLIAAGAELSFSKAQLAQFEVENEQAKKAMADKTDPADLQRRQRQQSVLKSIKELHPAAPAG